MCGQKKSLEVTDITRTTDRPAPNCDCGVVCLSDWLLPHQVGSTGDLKGIHMCGGLFIDGMSSNNETAMNGAGWRAACQTTSAWFRKVKMAKMMMIRLVVVVVVIVAIIAILIVSCV